MPSQIGLLKKGLDVTDDEGKVLYKSEELTREPRKSFVYAYCSDTKYTESILQQVKEVDLMYHEATFLNDMIERAELTYHSTAQQAAELANKAKVGKLILGHFSTRYKDLDPVLEEARKIFADSYLGTEGKDFILLE